MKGITAERDEYGGGEILQKMAKLAFFPPLDFR
jgi:hypothetical protein